MNIDPDKTDPDPVKHPRLTKAFEAESYTSASKPLAVQIAVAAQAAMEIEGPVSALQKIGKTDLLIEMVERFIQKWGKEDQSYMLFILCNVLTRLIGPDLVEKAMKKQGVSIEIRHFKMEKPDLPFPIDPDLN